MFNIVFNEGHCITQWGSTFWPEYRNLGILWFLVPGIPFYIISATIPLVMVPHIKQSLHIRRCKCFRWLNDWHNIAFCVQKMKHAMLTYQDLTFLVPKSWKPSDPRPKKFMVFFNNKHKAEDACLFFRSHILREAREYIKWFHTGMSTFYWSEEIELFKTVRAGLV